MFEKIVVTFNRMRLDNEDDIGMGEFFNRSYIAQKLLELNNIDYKIQSSHNSSHISPLKLLIYDELFNDVLKKII